VIFKSPWKHVISEKNGFVLLQAPLFKRAGGANHHDKKPVKGSL